MFRITKIETADRGKTTRYVYHTEGATGTYFNAKMPFCATYDTDINEVPESILAIPLLANVLPISWFAGFDILVPQLDRVYAEQMGKIKALYQKYYPQLQSVDSNLIVGTLVDNQYKTDKNGLLFSGGVDAYTSFLRHRDPRLDLITIHGADIDLEDQAQFERLRGFNDAEALLAPHRKLYVKANIRTFYTHKVDFLLPNLGWWGKIQYGMSLLALTAPYAFIHGYRSVYIASTRSVHMEFLPWGSMPEVDDLVGWGNTYCKHDAFELSRHQKMEYIVQKFKESGEHAGLRVCYSEDNTALNCSRCEKCLRTIFNIMILGDDPNSYGFEADQGVYDRLKGKLNNGFQTSGILNYWKELHQLAKDSEHVYSFTGTQTERQAFDELVLLIDQNCKAGVRTPSKWKKIKFRIINNNKKLFSYYLRLRHKLRSQK